MTCAMGCSPRLRSISAFILYVIIYRRVQREKKLNLAQTAKARQEGSSTLVW
jgi:hypothetical protein